MISLILKGKLAATATELETTSDTELFVYKGQQ